MSKQIIFGSHFIVLTRSPFAVGKFENHTAPDPLFLSQKFKLNPLFSRIVKQISEFNLSKNTWPIKILKSIRGLQTFFTLNHFYPYFKGLILGGHTLLKSRIRTLVRTDTYRYCRTSAQINFEYEKDIKRQSSDARLALLVYLNQFFALIFF